MKFRIIINIIILISGTVLLQGCIQEDKFGLSPFNEIKAFEIPGQAGTSTINKDESTITIPMGEGG
jgi:hypothetical protein